MSLERHDTQLSYSQSNCALVIFLMNGACQWSQQKIKYMLDYLDNPSTKKWDSKFTDQFYTKRTGTVNSTRVYAEHKGEICCANCGVFQDANKFTWFDEFQYQSVCQPCLWVQRKCTLRGRIKIEINRARHSTNIRKTRGRQMCDVEIDPEWYLTQINKQEGRCAISKMPLSFKSNTDFQSSIERIDNSVGYTPSNCMLIAREFQTSAQWTPGLFKIVHESMKAKYGDLRA
jgi:hypothetical protein